MEPHLSELDPQRRARLGEWLAAPWGPLPSSYADVAPLRGRFKSTPEDFEVEELPDAEPSGHGEHLYVWIEKRGLAAAALLEHVGRTLGLAEREVGYAGLKDKQAVTRQWLSLPARVEPRLSSLEGPQVTVLRTSRDEQKLKTGHLKGNRFRVRLRDVPPEDLRRAPALVARLAASGCPNYFGAQRFGRDGSTLALGRALLAGESRPVGRMLKRLALSAVQSAVFNTVLAARVEDGLLGKVLRGDVIEDLKLRFSSVVIDAELEQRRADEGRVVVLGPIPGPKMRDAKHDAGARERAVMHLAGLDAALLSAHRDLMPGTRRRVLLRAPIELTLGDGSLELRFELPSGAYATTLLAPLLAARDDEADAAEQRSTDGASAGDDSGQ